MAWYSLKTTATTLICLPTQALLRAVRSQIIGFLKTMKSLFAQSICDGYCRYPGAKIGLRVHKSLRTCNIFKVDLTAHKSNTFYLLFLYMRSWYSTGHEISYFYWTRRSITMFTKICHRTLSRASYFPVNILTPYFSKIHFGTKFHEWVLTWIFLPKFCIFSHFLRAYYMSCSSNPIQDHVGEPLKFDCYSKFPHIL
jgi:hypothetical protein